MICQICAALQLHMQKITMPIVYHASHLIFQLVLIVIVCIVRPDVVVAFIIVISLQINITCDFAIS